MNLDTIKSLDKLDISSVIEDAIRIVDEVEVKWRKGKKYYLKLNSQPHKVDAATYDKKINGVVWHSRVTNFEQFQDSSKEELYQKMDKYLVGSIGGLESTHTEFEKQYIHDLVDYELLPSHIDWEHDEFTYFSYIAVLHYKLQFPLKPRVFYEIIHIIKSKDKTKSYVISQPIQLAQEKYVKSSNPVQAKYSSVEVISFEKENGTLKWTMATCADSGGSVPKWLADWSMNSVIVQDIPSFLNWSYKVKDSH